MIHVILVFLTQLTYSISDLAKKFALGDQGFNLSVVKNPWFLFGLIFPLPAALLQLYLFAHFELARTVLLLGVFSAIFSVAFGVLLLHEHFSAVNYVGVGFAILAIVLVNLR